MFWRRTARVNDKYSGLMNKDDLIKEQFKQALNSTIKAISGETYSLKDKKNLNEFNISKFDNLKDKENFIKLRAEADSEALKENFLIIPLWNKIFQKRLLAIHSIKFLKK